MNVHTTREQIYPRSTREYIVMINYKTVRKLPDVRNYTVFHFFLIFGVTG